MKINQKNTFPLGRTWVCTAWMPALCKDMGRIISVEVRLKAV